ncbi:hypothetical protein PHMEG_00023355 [Phytophthora megakarya]|uniref:Uncharacterized protein n=1 Tax=Phytophthora megakarya TaxID=4795 RepID=A0A225VIC1_9STRA|nr:hypothetical protein PHMEG_00023355 [Phytophthora megakarya]
MAVFEKVFQTLRLERDQEREANKSLQSFLVGRLKKQAECQGVCDNGLKLVPEVTIQLKPMVPPEVKTLYATQTQAALRDLNQTKENVVRATTAKATTTTAVNAEATTNVQKGTYGGQASQPPEKRGPSDDEPSDDDNDSDKKSGDSDSDSSSFEDLASGTQVRATGQGTIMFNPIVNITALEDFEEKQPLAVRMRWLEKFQSLAVMGR